MALLLVGYDLTRKGEHDYEPVWTALRESGTWWHALDSTWLVVTPMTAVQMRDRLAALVHSDDRVLVFDVTGRWRAWRGFSSNASDWLRNH